MDVYRVPKETARVLMDAPPDPPRERLLFLSGTSGRHRGPETVSDLLSTPDLFVPVAEEGDGFVLLRKDAIRWVRVEDPGRVEWLFTELKEGWPRIPIRCEFPEGDALEGEVYAMAPEGERRVTDVVNRQEGFLPLEVGDALYLVNLLRVKTIRTMEESRGGAG
jgi:hypothetical protein